MTALQPVAPAEATPPDSSSRLGRRMRRIGPWRILVSSLVLLAVVVVWGLLLGGHILAQEVISQSMEPTVLKGDRVLVVRDYLEPTPFRRGDIVMVASPDDGDLPLLKRLVALPDDEIVIVRNQVFVNHQPTREDLAGRGVGTAKYSYWYKLKDDEYFVLGDNRGNSYDSLFFGPVRRDMILGKALFRYSPVKRMGWLSPAAEEEE